MKSILMVYKIVIVYEGQLLWNRWAEEWVELYDDSTMAWFTVSFISIVYFRSHHVTYIHEIFYSYNLIR